MPKDSGFLKGEYDVELDLAACYPLFPGPIKSSRATELRP